MTLLNLPTTQLPRLGEQPATSARAEFETIVRCPPPAPDQASKLRDLVRQHEAALRSPAMPLPASLPGEAPRAVAPAARVPRPEALAGGRPKVIAITSGKGGVGKTNLSVNLAIRFAQAGKSAILLDADMGLANADLLCGLDLRHNLAHVIARRKQLSEIISEAPGGFRLVGGASGLAKMADLPEQERQMLLSSLGELERSCELMLIDTGAGISQNVLCFTRGADHVLVVTTPEPTAIADAYATIKVICREREETDRRPISLVVNQVKSASEARSVYERVAKVSRDFIGVNLGDAGYLPLDPAVGRAVRQRSPFLLRYPKCAASVCVSRLAMRLEAGMAGPASDRTPEASAGFFGMLARALRVRREPALVPRPA